MEFLGGIVFTAFILFLGVKIKKVKIEFGDFKEETVGSGPLKKGGKNTTDQPPSQVK